MGQSASRHFDLTLQSFETGRSDTDPIGSDRQIIDTERTRVAGVRCPRYVGADVLRGDSGVGNDGTGTIGYVTRNVPGDFLSQQPATSHQHEKQHKDGEGPRSQTEHHRFPPKH
jgi:hypothetical protein